MSDILAVAAMIGVLAAVFQLRQVRKQRKREFEDLFVQRYWSIMDRLSTSALESVPHSGAIRDEDRRAVIAYFRLSEDELDLRARNWISRDAWELWRDGIATQLRRWPFDEIWREVAERESQAGADGQFVQLRRADIEIYQEGFDPRTEPTWWHWRGR
ncbi:hypothetical protein [Marmoricola sp. URHB0036]|uniref:hypothetical protein n=1 Tax=Marmoricola sp. URHB0036 TaxID=1298863 RepID=UPI000488B5A1|nr:hypothetical protein [Marmoricola sp. URHB0036]